MLCRLVLTSVLSIGVHLLQQRQWILQVQFREIEDVWFYSLSYNWHPVEWIMRVAFWDQDLDIANGARYQAGIPFACMFSLYSCRG